MAVSPEQRAEFDAAMERHRAQEQRERVEAAITIKGRIRDSRESALEAMSDDAYAELSDRRSRRAKSQS